VQRPLLVQRVLRVAVAKGLNAGVVVKTAPCFKDLHNSQALDGPGTPRAAPLPEARQGHGGHGAWGDTVVQHGTIPGAFPRGQLLRQFSYIHAVGPQPFGVPPSLPLPFFCVYRSAEETLS
jgi:hypothetical protein